MDPFKIFEDWYREELQQTTAKIPAACCLSTIGLDGYPNARFVALKELKEETFIICGPLSSRKGEEIKNMPKAALTFWWTSTERQVRIQGDVTKISETDADRYFSERNRPSQIISSISDQGKTIEDLQVLDALYTEKEISFKNNPVERPANWGGLAIMPVRIEFLEFSPTRFHKRILYQKNEARWLKEILQP